MKTSAAHKRERQLFIAAFMSPFPISTHAIERTCWRAMLTLPNETRSRLIAALVDASPYALQVRERTIGNAP